MPLNFCRGLREVAFLATFLDERLLVLLDGATESKIEAKTERSEVLELEITPCSASLDLADVHSLAILRQVFLPSSVPNKKKPAAPANKPMANPFKKEPWWCLFVIFSAIQPTYK